jgi:hypothetical protein
MTQSNIYIYIICICVYDNTQDLYHKVLWARRHDRVRLCLKRKNNNKYKNKCLAIQGKKIMEKKIIVALIFLHAYLFRIFCFCWQEAEAMSSRLVERARRCAKCMYVCMYVFMYVCMCIVCMYSIKYYQVI